MNFTWDEEKANKVKHEHSIEFSKIIEIFEIRSPLSSSTRNTPPKTKQYAIIGITIYGLVYLVFTELEPDEVHFITARLAENWMVKEYEESKRRY